MAKLLRMPEVAANVLEAVLQEWTVPARAAFSARDVLAMVETDKAVVDVEAAEDGIILEQLVPAGESVRVGMPIAVLGAPGEQVDDLAALLAELGVTDSPAPPEGGFQGHSRAESPLQATAGAGGRLLPQSPEGGFQAVHGAEGGFRAEASGGGGPQRKFASPLARRLAREAGLVLAEIPGTGPGGRVVRRDVEAVVAGRAAAGADESEVDTPAAYTEIPHSRMRRAIAARLTESVRDAPHFSLRATLRVDKLLKLRKRLNESAATPVSVTDLLVKAAAVAHVRVPELNVIWTPDAVRSFSSVDISVAVATDRGLVTPVVTGVETRSISALATAVRDLVERARSGRLRQDELEGGTLTVTNLGMYGTEEFAAIINPPQSAILAVGAARAEPVVRNGRLSTATVIRCTLSVDHRPVDGVVAARWLAAFVDTVEHPIRILA